MGWYGEYCNRKQKIADLTKSSETCECTKHCYRGNAFRGVLWSVWTPKVPGAEHLKPFIHCDVMEYRDGMWFNKPLTEGMGPFYYSCPLGYLDMAPEENADWREGVRAYHAQAKQRRLAKAS